MGRKHHTSNAAEASDDKPEPRMLSTVLVVTPIAVSLGVLAGTPGRWIAGIALLLLLVALPTATRRFAFLMYAVFCVLLWVMIYPSALGA